jgi:integrase/recombinase XerC/integrase/recombinase XerD
MAERKSRSLSSTTIQFYTTYLTPFMDSIKGQALDVTKEDIAQFLDSLSCSPGGKHAYFRAIRAFYRWAWEEGYIDAIPRMKAPKVPKPLRYVVSLKDVAKLLESADNVRDKLIVSMLADTGLRRSELASIRILDVDTDTHILRVWGKRGKGKTGTLWAYHCPATLLTQWLRERPEEDMLFNLNKWGIGEMLERLERKTGIKCNAHSFRRLFATQSIRQGMNLFHTQSLLGHSSLTMTRLYAQEVDSHDAIQHYKPILG